MPTTAPVVVTATPTSTVGIEPTIETAMPEPDLLACLTPRHQAAQLLLALLTEPELIAAADIAAVGDLGGIGLLGTPGAGLAEGLAALQDRSFAHVLVASDEEGGSVQRLDAVLGAMPSAKTMATTMSTEQVEQMWFDYATRASNLGIDVFFGPVLDVGSAPGILSRSFGDTPDIVADFAGAVASGLVRAGITPVFKHFPGHGRASADSHLELPSTPAIDEVRKWDLVPYQTLLERPELIAESAVMIGHLSVPGLSDGEPTSLSRETVDGLLRTELGFDGLVFTDAINMGAIVNSYGTVQAAERSLRAGSDIVILGALSDVGPVLDHLTRVMQDDVEFADLVAQRALRVLATKDQSDLCDGVVDS